MHTRATPDLFPTEGTVLLHISQAIKQDQVITIHMLDVIMGFGFLLGAGQRVCEVPKGILLVYDVCLTPCYRQGWAVSLPSSCHHSLLLWQCQ